MLEEEHHQILKSRRKETQTSKLQTQPQSSIIVHTTKMYCREITFLNIISNQPSVVIQSDKCNTLSQAAIAPNRLLPNFDN